MKKDIGSVVALYPTPTTVVGAIVDGKVNWLNIAHIGIVGLDAVMISSNKSHFTNWGIKENRKLSINLVSEEMLKAADYVGLVSGISTDKSDVFKYHMGELNVPKSTYPLFLWSAKSSTFTIIKTTRISFSKSHTLMLRKNYWTKTER